MEDADQPEVGRPPNDLDGGPETEPRWDGITSHRVTDLFLFSTEDLTAMAAALEARGLVVSHSAYWITDTDYWRIDEPQWFWAFQTSCEDACDDPEHGVATLLAAVEALDPPERAAWDRCSRRVFDIAYDCGTRPPTVRHELSAGTLARLAEVGGSLRVCLYSQPERSPAEPGAAPDPAAG